MDLLKERILRDGKYIGNGILKVDGFINHQVDPVLMNEAGKEFARLFKDISPTKILTAEISGIAPAVSTGLHMKIPVVFARKHKPITMPDQVLLTLSPSHTKGRMVELIVSPEYLGVGERVLIIDDFLATGKTIEGLIKLTEIAGATVVGVGALIEKTFEEGRQHLEDMNLLVHSLARIESMSEDGIIFH
ncbi:MAG: xanthine phosphoribosyltransferase [Anaerolineales bacterium]|nr:xanthine phosphoribosyltransferase [Anaerolineales bacterium]